MGMDIEEHGAVFSSPALGHDESFEYEVSPTLAGMTVPFHNHLNHDMTGMLMVDENAANSGTFNIEIHDSMYVPSDITVQPGTTLVFTNTSENPQAVTSGIMTDDHEDGEEDSHEDLPTVAVEGLQDTLQVEVTHIASNVSMTKPLGTVFGDPGHYKTDFIPTAPGDYRFRFFGSIEGIEVNETFESSPNTFSSVEAASELHFPETISAAREIEGAARGAQTSAQEAQAIATQARTSASSASTLGIIGIVVGVIGIIVGGGAGFLAMRKQG
jgi:plastocyanin